MCIYTRSHVCIYTAALCIKPSKTRGRGKLSRDDFRRRKDKSEKTRAPFLARRSWGTRIYIYTYIYHRLDGIQRCLIFESMSGREGKRGGGQEPPGKSRIKGVRPFGCAEPCNELPRNKGCSSTLSRGSVGSNSAPVTRAVTIPRRVSGPRPPLFTRRALAARTHTRTLIHVYN